jgi:hypothetical protein
MKLDGRTNANALLRMGAQIPTRQCLSRRLRSFMRLQEIPHLVDYLGF